MPRIAFLGPEGTFTEAALIRMAHGGMVPVHGPSQEVTPVPTDSTTAALAAVRSADCGYACVPIENSIEGSVLPTLDSLATGPELQIFAELTLDVAFTIVVRPGTGAADVRTVAAFPVASAQVRHWLAANLPNAALIPANSNAAAAGDVVDGRADAGVSTALAAIATAWPRWRPPSSTNRTPGPGSCWSGRRVRRRRAPARTGRRWSCDSTPSPVRWFRR